MVSAPSTGYKHLQATFRLKLLSLSRQAWRPSKVNHSTGTATVRDH